jgi:hypothetical protein
VHEPVRLDGAGAGLAVPPTVCERKAVLAAACLGDHGEHVGVYRGCLAAERHGGQPQRGRALA